MTNAEDTPFGRAVSLGRFAHIPIRAHWSVLVLVGLFVVVLSTQTLPAVLPGARAAEYWLGGTITAVTFFVTLVSHELAHAVLARRYGMDAKRITLWMLGGLTELGKRAPSPRADAAVAAAGPLTSLMIGLAFVGAAMLGGPGIITACLWWLGAVNVLLAVFNLLPGAPLDGGRLLRALLWWRSGDYTRSAQRAVRVGRGLGLVLVVLGLAEAVVGMYGGVWLALVGWFVLSAAEQEGSAVRADALSGVTAVDVMRPATVVPTWFTVDQLIRSSTFEQLGRGVLVLVDTDGRYVGTTTVSALDRVDPERRATTRMADLHAVRSIATAGTTPVPDLLVDLARRAAVAVVVDADHRPEGLLTQADVARASGLARLGWAPDGASHGDGAPARS